MMLVISVIPSLVLLLISVLWKEVLRTSTGLISELDVVLGFYGLKSHDEAISEHLGDYHLLKLYICTG
jgi:hypothetical protein